MSGSEHGWLKYTEFMDQAPDEPGSIRINHEDDHCSGSSKSLKIERKEDGTISAYCFRCGKRGFHTTDFSRVQAARKVSGFHVGRDATARRGNDKPRDATQATSTWPLPAISWLKQWGLTRDETTQNRIAYSPHFNRITFDISWDGEYNGYVARRVDPAGNGPKWLQFASTPYYQRCSEEGSDVLVLVEDVISAIRVARVADVIALLTTTLNDDTLAKIANYDRYVVWLDDDNRQVKMNQLKLARRLSAFAPTKVIHDTDPKRCSDERIYASVFGDIA